MQKIMLTYDYGDEFESGRIVVPFYYESAEAALVHFMNQVRVKFKESQEQDRANQVWRQEYDNLQALKNNPEKYNKRAEEVFKLRPNFSSLDFNFAGETYSFHNFIKFEPATKTKKAQWVEYPPEILTIEEYFSKHSSNKPE